jgi:hypothetical protein
MTKTVAEISAAALGGQVLHNTDDLRRKAAGTASHFFDTDTMRAFKSRVGGAVYGNRYFVTSEPDYDGSDRRYTVREFAFTEAKRESDNRVVLVCEIATVGEFREHATSAIAHRVARELGNA